MPDSPDSLCDRIQQFRQRMRSRCIEAHQRDEPVGLPCLLQSWKRRIEAMDDAPPPHHKLHRRRGCHSPSSSSSSSTCSSDASSSPPPSAPLCPFSRPRTHPRLERQQATCAAFTGFWSGFSSSPPPSPDLYAKPRRRCHPYARCHPREDKADDQRQSSP